MQNGISVRGYRFPVFFVLSIASVPALLKKSF